MPRRRDPNLPHADELAWSFGQRVSSLRRRKGLDSHELSIRSGMSVNYIWRVEQGLVVPNLRSVARLALALGIPLPLLLENVDVTSVRLENRSYRKRSTLSEEDRMSAG